MVRVRGAAAPMARVVTTTPSPRGAVRGFARWVASEIPAGGRVLNVGAGQNLSGPLAPVRRRAGVLVGVDPDSSIHGNLSLDERHQMSMEQYARSGPDPFDVAFSVFVLEHVRDPGGFVEACAAVLRPGGCLLGLTVNKWHYFGLSTWATTRVGLAEPLLHRLRPKDMENYHFPTEYRLNTIGTLDRYLGRNGFTSVEYRCWDLPAMYEPYLPKRVRGFATTYDRWAYRLGSPHLMGHITFAARLGEAGR